MSAAMKDPLFDEYNQHLERCSRLLPAWFIPRMTCDTWTFGLLLSTGQLLAITHIDDVRRSVDGSLWIDVTMHTDPVELPPKPPSRWAAPLHAPTSRDRASINVAYIVCAMELADT